MLIVITLPKLVRGHISNTEMDVVLDVLNLGLLYYLHHAIGERKIVVSSVLLGARHDSNSVALSWLLLFASALL